MKLKQITNYLESIAPLHLQESYDNSGLIVGDPEQNITAAIISLDCTEVIVDEAMAKGANCIISHHPIVFAGLKRFNGSNYIERTIIKAIQNNIAIYAIHTNLDNVHPNGVNEEICKRLELDQLSILAKQPDVSHEHHAVGAGMIGVLATPMSEISFLRKLKDVMNVSMVKHTALLDQQIEKVAVCGGSGSFLLDRAIQAGAQCFITADYKYHQFFDANDRIVIADIGHYESEQYTKELIHRLISEKFTNFAAHLTEHNTNPVHYL